MNRVSRLIAISLTSGGLLAGTVLPAAAQPTTQCAIASDAVISQALGPAAHAQGLVTPVGMDTCLVFDGSSDKPITVLHLTGILDPSGLAQPAAGAPSFNKFTPPWFVQGTPDATSMSSASASAQSVPGLGDYAMLLSATQGGQTVTTLTVVSGTDTFSFVSEGGTDAPTKLPTLAKAVIANFGQSAIY